MSDLESDIRDDIRKRREDFVQVPDSELDAKTDETSEQTIRRHLEGTFPAREWWWLESTKELQTKVYGYNLEGFADAIRDPNLIRHRPLMAQLTRYLDWNTTAAVQELAELREEFSWKPWAVDEPFANRDRILEEAVDVLHFIGNILTGIGLTDADLWRAYVNKQQRNRGRAASGTYSARKGGLSQGSDF